MGQLLNERERAARVGWRMEGMPEGGEKVSSKVNVEVGGGWEEGGATAPPGPTQSPSSPGFGVFPDFLHIAIGLTSRVAPLVAERRGEPLLSDPNESTSKASSSNPSSSAIAEERVGNVNGWSKSIPSAFLV